MRDKRANIGRFGAVDYTTMTNDSNDKRSIAFDMLTIDRSTAAYIDKKFIDNDADIRKWDQGSSSSHTHTSGEH